MVEELREAIEQVERQPEEIQRRIAQIITEELEEREWDALVSSPTSQQFLAHLSAGIDAQEAAGEVEDGAWDYNTLIWRRFRAGSGHKESRWSPMSQPPTDSAP